MNRFELRQTLRRQPGMWRAVDLMERLGVKADKLYRTLHEMERAGEVVRWGSRGYTRWQILRSGQTKRSMLWQAWGWPDPMEWPREGVPLGYTA